MKKYQEALDELVNSKENFVYHEGKMVQIKNIQSSKLLQELVDKATPFKPNHIRVNSEERYGTCKCLSTIFENNNYCKHCGQAIDWSNE